MNHLPAWYAKTQSTSRPGFGRGEPSRCAEPSTQRAIRCATRSVLRGFSSAMHSTVDITPFAFGRVTADTPLVCDFGGHGDEISISRIEIASQAISDRTTNLEMRRGRL